MKLVHYSKRHVETVRSHKQHPEPDQKPQGFWLSCDGFKMNWREWCEGEQFALDCFTHVHDVRLERSANILRLRSAEDIDAFTERFQQEPSWAVGRTYTYHQINWRAVAKCYQGIIIAPYIWERRLHEVARWYYCWDCASGCVWDAAAIKSIDLRRPTFDEFNAAAAA